MTVAELKAVLNTLPDDTEIFVNHERTKLRHPELFYSPHSEMIDAPELNIVPSFQYPLTDRGLCDDGAGANRLPL